MVNSTEHNGENSMLTTVFQGKVQLVDSIFDVMYAKISFKGLNHGLIIHPNFWLCLSPYQNLHLQISHNLSEQSS